ncbi:MAG: tetratricopeptide repeat protein [Bacteroidota bacterium]
MKKIIHLLMFTFALLAARGSDGISVFEQANTAYQNQQFEEAIKLYEQVLSSGQESAEVYFNLANAHYRLKNTGESILNYERALQLAPDDEDIAFNLDLAQLRVVDKLEAAPRFFIVEAWENFRQGQSSSGWAWAGVILLWIAAGLGALFVMSGSTGLKRVGFFGGIAALLLGLVSLFISMDQRDQEIDSKMAIIMQPNAYGKSTPTESGTDVFILHEGAKVWLEESLGEWVEVRLIDGKRAWMQTTVLEKI